MPEDSDIGICINRHNAKKLLEELNTHVLVAGVCARKKSFMMQLEIVLNDGGVLHLDLISKFKRKSMVFMDAEADQFPVKYFWIKNTGH